jgi:hypothetical protein
MAIQVEKVRALLTEEDRKNGPWAMGIEAVSGARTLRWIQPFIPIFVITRFMRVAQFLSPNGSPGQAGR